MKRKGEVPAMIRAAIDIGSNTVKTLVMGQSAEGCWASLASWCSTTGLGHGLREGQLAPLAMATTRRAIVEQVQLIRQNFPGAEIRGAATSAVRESVNGRQFLDGCEGESGLPPGTLRILTGEEEAEGTFRGASAAFSGPFFNGDPGGGSTECAMGRPGDVPEKRCSLPLGCVRWADWYDLRDRIRPENLRRAQEDAEALLVSAVKDWQIPPELPLSISGGTAHAIASLQAGHLFPAFQPMPWVSRGDLEALLETMASLPLAEREKLPGMPSRRAAVMVAGGVILLALMNVRSAERFLPNPFGLRYFLATQDVS